MSTSRIRIQIVALAFLLFPAAAGVLAIHASATCERFVRTYITKPVRNRVSKQTAEAWAKWRLAHPNWKPNPNVHRPKYVMSREEAMNRVQTACAVDVIPAQTDGLLDIANVEPPPAVIDLPRMTTEINFPDQVPPEVAELTPDNSWPSLGPYVPPVLSGSAPGSGGFPVIVPPIPPQQTVVPPGPVPEPSSLVLFASGLFVMLLGPAIRRMRRSSAR